jgi:purine-nucleoside phosphorylase
MSRLGAKLLIITNAAGAVNSKYRPGNLMVIRDHLNLTGVNPLTGPNVKELGTRFPDLSKVYDRKLSRVAKQAAGRGGREGVYIGFHGPSYETPAEIRMARKLGADAAGMSTVLEVIAAAHAGMKVVGISCMTNMAAGISRAPLLHEDVVEVSARVETSLEMVLKKVWPGRTHPIRSSGWGRRWKAEAARSIPGRTSRIRRSDCRSAPNVPRSVRRSPPGRRNSGALRS